MRPRSGIAAVALGAAGLALLAITALLLLAVLIGPPDPAGCGTDVSSGNEGQVLTSAAGSDAHSLTAWQRRNAAAIVVTGRQRHLPDQAIVVALAVASQESRFTNYANDGRGGDLMWSQSGIERSLQLPHEAVGTDHGSLGVFQQQWPWWGTMRELMTPATAAGKFYDALARVSGWESMPVTVAAQRVQRSAYPSAYADDESLARSLLASAGKMPTAQSAVWGTGTVDCAAATTSSAAVFPLPTGSGYVDRGNWGGRGARWSHGHTGTDLSVACGTPVLAATAGTVLVRTDQAWSGPWLVQVSTGSGRLTTWYAHMRRIDVHPGQTVTAGQRLGEVGDLGNATGCHLHFEVHPRGGSIYQDNINPSIWLHAHVGHTLGRRPPDVQTMAQGAAERGARFTVATFNTLGASHTTATGKHPGMASGPARTRGLVRLLDKHHVDVAGLQEFQAPQYRAFIRLAGSRYVVFHPPGDTENSIIWRRDRWRRVDGGWFAVPYFDGHRRRMPVVRLIDRHGGSAGRLVAVVTVHNPADTRRYPHQQRWRARALAIEARLVQAMTRGGESVIVTGDFNDRRAPLCVLAAQARLHAADASKRTAAGCRPGPRAGIDRILASRALTLSEHRVDRSSLVRTTSDHPFLTASTDHTD